ncbi:hypothetical protein SLA2020_273980 [Shorea laevis]
MQAEKLADKGLRPHTPPAMGMPSMLMAWARATLPVPVGGGCGCGGHGGRPPHVPAEFRRIAHNVISMMPFFVVLPWQHACAKWMVFWHPMLRMGSRR